MGKGFRAKKILNLFKFKGKTFEDAIEDINIEYPIGLKYNRPLITKIHKKYPYIEKYEVAIIVLTTFTTMREILLNGNIINLYNLFCNFKLHFFKRANHKDLSVLKVSISTPGSIKNGK